MRHWIETGHDKTFWKVPTLLKIAMDVLDDHLDDACCFHQSLERGDMVFANNAMLAHARDQFKNDPNAPPRHKVRAWIQVQKAAILNDEHSSATKNVSINSYLVHLQMNCSYIHTIFLDLCPCHHRKKLLKWAASTPYLA